MKEAKPGTKQALHLFAAVHGFIAFLFFCAALALIGIAIRTSSEALAAGFDGEAAQGIIEAIGLVAIAVVGLQFAQTILEEEVVREAHISAPTRVRRYLSRFMVVIVVALAVEGMVAVFKSVHKDLANMPYAASILMAVAFLLAGWGVFLRLNRSAEELEPEAMQQAKQEDRKLE